MKNTLRCNSAFIELYKSEIQLAMIGKISCIELISITVISNTIVLF